MSRRMALALLLPAFTGCAGVYATAGLSVLPNTRFTPGTKEAAPDAANPSMFSTTAVATVGVGADFDIGRRFRVTVGYEQDRQNFAPGADANYGGGAAEFDFTLADLSERLKLRGAAGFSVGQGVGSASLPGMAGETVKFTAAQSQGGSGLIGLDLTYFPVTFFALHLLLGPDIVGQRVPGGSEIGIGGTIRVAASLYLGDTRPNSTIVEHMKSHLNVMPAVAAGARKLGCKVDNSVHDTWAALSVTCADEREVFFFQTADAVVIKCPHMGEGDCRHKLDEMLDGVSHGHH